MAAHRPRPTWRSVSSRPSAHCPLWLGHDRDHRDRHPSWWRGLSEPATSAGPPVAVADLKIMDADGLVECPCGTVGELWSRGPMNARGYWNKPEATAETFVDGWVRTGDLARLDEEGFLYIVDRAKDMVIRGGENIYSIEVENALYDHPAVAEAALLGDPIACSARNRSPSSISHPTRRPAKRSCRPFSARGWRRSGAGGDPLPGRPFAPQRQWQDRQARPPRPVRAGGLTVPAA